MASDVVVKLTARTDGFDPKIKTSDKVLKDFVKSGSTTSQVFKGMSDSIGLNIGKLGPYGAAAAAASGAIKAFSDALKSNELIADEWGRITESAGAVYKGFVTTLTQGDFSGFLSNMREIIQSARDAYDAMDALGTFDAFNQINVLKAQNKFQSSIVDYREGRITKDELRVQSDDYRGILEARAKMQQEAYEAAIRKWAQTQQVSQELAVDVLSNYSNEQYEALKQRQFTGTKYETYFIEGAYGMEERVREIPNAAPSDDWEALAVKLRTLKDDELKAMQAIGSNAKQTRRQIIDLDKQIARLANNVKGAKGTVEESVPTFEPIAALPTYNFEALPTPELEGLNAQIQQTGQSLQEAFMVGSLPDLLAQLAEMRNTLGGITIGTEEWSAQMQEIVKVQGQINAMQKKINGGGAEGQEAASGTGDAWQYAANAVASVGTALQSIEDPGAKVTGIVMQAVANIALGAATAISTAAANPSTSGWVWFAYVASAMATMAGTIASIRSATSGFADGGLVPGTPNGGHDTVPAMLSPGEVVLNAAQQRNVASYIGANNSIQGLYLTTDIRGENLRITLRNNNIRRGGNRNKYNTF